MSGQVPTYQMFRLSGDTYTGNFLLTSPVLGLHNMKKIVETKIPDLR
jgi:hypothetical protein